MNLKGFKTWNVDDEHGRLQIDLFLLNNIFCLLFDDFQIEDEMKGHVNGGLLRHKDALSIKIIVLPAAQKG